MSEDYASILMLRRMKAPEEQAMDFFGWTWLAKALAAKAGWDVVEEIEI